MLATDLSDAPRSVVEPPEELVAEGLEVAVVDNEPVEEETGAGRRRRRRLPVRLASLYYMGNRSPSHTSPTSSTTPKHPVPPRTRIKVLY